MLTSDKRTVEIYSIMNGRNDDSEEVQFIIDDLWLQWIPNFLVEIAL